MGRKVAASLLGMLLLTLGQTAGAANLALQGELKQGGLVVGQTAPGSQVWLAERDLRVSPDGYFVFGFGRQASGPVELRVRTPAGATLRRQLTVAERDYAIQRIDGLPPKKVSPPPAVLERIRREARQVAAARAHDSPRTAFLADFQWPVTGPITGVYGSQRVLNGQPRRPHYGIDIAAATGTPVKAPAAGVVALAQDDLYFSGGTLIVDHGHGISSTFLHLDEITVAPGQTVAQGEVIAKVGATGRVTGAHLDWRINWFQTRLDPALLVPPMPAP